jgi:hypothetical protein
VFNGEIGIETVRHWVLNAAPYKKGNKVIKKNLRNILHGVNIDFWYKLALVENKRKRAIEADPRAFKPTTTTKN